MQAVSSMFKPYGIGNVLMFLAIMLLLVFKPSFADPSTHWALVAVAVVLLLAWVFVIKGTLRLKQIRKAAREDRRRFAAGLPLDPEQPEETKA